MRISRFTSIIVATSVCAAGSVVGMGTVSAAPIDTAQVPARATGISGILVPSIYPVPVHVESTASAGTVSLSGAASQSACATTIGRALVRVTWRNTVSGHTGSTTIKPCNNGYNPATPHAATVNVGTGRVTFVSTVTGSPDLPTAGQPAFPGNGSFTAN